MVKQTLKKQIETKIHIIRDQRVMLDSDLAELYGVETKAINQAVSRNKERFPSDFIFRLGKQEFVNLKSQNVTSSLHGGRRRSTPLVFTEQGVAMLSSVLKSKQAAMVNVEIMRTFVRLRQLIQSNQVLAQKMAALEKKYDGQFKVVFEAIRQMMKPASGKERIGF